MNLMMGAYFQVLGSDSKNFLEVILYLGGGGGGEIL